MEPLRRANECAGRTLYEIGLHAVDGGDIVASSGIPAPCTEPPERLGRRDLVLLVGGDGAEHYQNPRLLSWLRLQGRRGAWLAGIGPAAFILARCGLLDGIEATTHWPALPGFRERFGNVLAVEKLFCASDRIMTCAGGSAAVEMMLHVITTQHGPLLARQVADVMMVQTPRTGDAAQRPRTAGSSGQLHPSVRAAMHLIEDHIGDPLTVPETAARLGLSQRQLERHFQRDVGCSVIQFRRQKRLQHARVLLQTTGLTVLEVATACGFSTLPHFTTAFKSCFGETPSACQKRAPAQAAATNTRSASSRFMSP